MDFRSLVYAYKFLFPLVLCLYVSATCYSQVNNHSANNWHKKHDYGFVKNIGQITNQFGKSMTDIRYLYSAPGFKVVFKDNSFSYEVNTTESTKETIVSLIEKDILLKFKEPEKTKIKTHRIDINLPDANNNAQLLAEEKSNTVINYYSTGSSIKKATSFAKLTYKNIWPNIDIVFYAKKEGELKYDIILHPGAKLTDVKFIYNGAENITLQEGKLNIKTSLATIRESIPYSYMQENGQKANISYTQNGNNISLVGNYDKSQTLIIDPVVTWAWGTYYGATGDENAYSVTTDIAGNVYMAGYTTSASNVASTGAYQTTLSGDYDALLVKFNKDGKRLWATYYGGKKYDAALSVSTDSKGSVYLAGNTKSTSGISTTGAHQAAHAGGPYYDSTDAFLVKFDSSGARKWATYYGGSGIDRCYSMATDKSGNIYLSGNTNSTSSIATAGAHKSANANYYDAFLVKFDSSGKRQWGTYYGGSSVDEAFCYGIATDREGNVYIAGNTTSTTDIATSGAHQSTKNSAEDAFLVKFNSSGKRLWATYYGGGFKDVSLALATDTSGNVFLSGYTTSTTSIATSKAHQPIKGSAEDAFLVKFNKAGTRLWATYYGASGIDYGYAVATDTLNSVYMVGNTKSNFNIATSGSHQPNHASAYGFDAYLVKFDSTGNRIWGTYYGGISDDWAYSLATDAANNVYMAGYTGSASGIASSGSYQSSRNSVYDAFLIKFNDAFADAGVVSIDSIPSTSCGANISVYVRLKNYSPYAKIDTVYVGWTLNGSAKPSRKLWQWCRVNIEYTCY